MTVYMNENLSAATDTFQAQQHKKVSYVPAYASPISATEQQEYLAILASIPEQATAALTRLTVPNYHVDRTLREVILASPQRWREELDIPTFTSSEKLGVHLGTSRTYLKKREAWCRIQQLCDSTALTARIVLGLWNIRRSNKHLTKDGSTAMRLEEVLEWRGIKKHSYLASSEGVEKRYTNGYEMCHNRQVLRDLDLLASCYVMGHVTCTVKGKKVPVDIQSPYLCYSIVTQKTPGAEDSVAGVFVAPGPWINAYTDQDNYFLAEIDRKIFQFHPQYQRHELRLALYLAERWRQVARDSTFHQALSMADLLMASMIPVDKTNLTTRFVPRIEHALETLWERRILGSPARCTTPIPSQVHWGNAWLASQWILLPPPEIREFYQATLRSVTNPGEPPSLKAERRKPLRKHSSAHHTMVG